MDEKVIFTIEASTDGLKSVNIDSVSDEGLAFGHRVLSQVAPQLRSLNAALKLIGAEVSPDVKKENSNVGGRDK